MKKWLIIILFLLGTSHMVLAGENMKIKMTINNQTIIIRLKDNPAATQFLNMLPAEFTFRDFAGEEKISYFPNPIDLSNTPCGMIAQKGKLFIYAPWGNFGIFYKNHGTKIDNDLVEMGTVESGLEILSAQKNPFIAKIEVIE